MNDVGKGLNETLTRMLWRQITKGMSVNEVDGDQFKYQIPSRNSVTSYTLPGKVVSMATGALYGHTP